MATVKKTLVLVGGGHSHAIALKQFGRHPIPGLRLILISPTVDTPYSGMLPGHVAGLYSYEECHIQLRPLAKFAGAEFYLDQAIALDLNANQVICAQRPAVDFDVVSLDIGSTPTLPPIPGAGTYSVPVKPWRTFLAQWQQLITQLSQNPHQKLSLAIVGGGAGGVELSLAVQHRLHQILQAAQQPLTNLTIHLFHQGEAVMSHHNAWVSDRFDQTLRQRGIQLHLGEQVSQVEAHTVFCDSGLQLSCDHIFWVTHATAPAWLREAGLSTDERGFIQVNKALQSLSHCQVFAAGDIATMVKHPRPKAGVFAVRQGKPLFRNLQRFFRDQALKPYHPQKYFLSLISTGNRNAVASWGPFPWGWESPWLWRWKDHIDRQFMQQFQDLS